MKPEQNIGDGPGGGGDHFLLTRANGVPGPGGRLAVFNEDSDWLGDYVELGVSAIEVDLRNFSDRPLSIRFAIQGLSAANVTHRAVSSTVVVLPAFSQWISTRFAIGAMTLTGSRITDEPLVALRNVTQVRLIHNPAPEFAGVIISGGLGVDNVRLIPEPDAGLLLVVAIPFIFARRRGRPF